MKKNLFTFAVCCMSVIAIAQSSQLATLNHAGTITTYYGGNALSDAHKAAQNGDVITLSAGSFNGVDLTKAITLRGAGAGMDTTQNASVTIINSSIKINIPASDNSLIVEGIYFQSSIICTSVTNPQFLKCRFVSLSGIMNQASILHCKIFNFSNNASLGGTILNSVLLTGNVRSCTFTNCIVKLSQSTLNEYIDEDTNGYIVEYNWENGLRSNIFYNSVIRFEGGILDRSNLAYNCIGIQKDEYDYYTDPDGVSTYPGYNYFLMGSIFAGMPQSVQKTNYNVADFTEILKSGNDISVSDEETYELSDKGKMYKGNDGTEIGIYGGQMSFDPRTTTPQITKCNVAAKSTPDGKLSVDIEVSGLE